MSMYLTPFASIFPEQGARETRVITTIGYPGLPDDEYALLEAYCADPECDCRRVMLNVVGRHQGDKYLASVSYGFDAAEDCFYFHCAPEGKKIDFLRANPLVWGQVLADDGRLDLRSRQERQQDGADTREIGDPVGRGDSEEVARDRPDDDLNEGDRYG